MLFTSLSNAYIIFPKQILIEYSDFHGSRYLYHLIKLISRKSEEIIDKGEILDRHNIRNFDGDYGSIKKFERIYEKRSAKFSIYE